MTFCIITHVVHTEKDGKYYGYAPYISEMNIWLRHVDKVVVVAPKADVDLNPIHAFYNHSSIQFSTVRRFDTLTLTSKVKALLAIPKNCWTIYKAMQYSDHIHLRCPGNIGLLGCIIQVFFPSKPKTAKYAGNWDPNSKQPLSYRIQKWILSNTFLTKNMQVLVYGEWENQTKNIKPFFTATYKEEDKILVETKAFDNGIKFIFVGTLSAGKRPFYAIQLIEQLSKKHKNISLEIYGDGVEKKALQTYIFEKKLNNYVALKGNQSQESIKKAYINSHFVILPSKSEGWPKVIAEGMFWGCLPIATAVSCVPKMLDNGKRGLLLEMNLDSDIQLIEKLLENREIYHEKMIKAIDWSRKYTVNFFENEIKKLVERKND